MLLTWFCRKCDKELARMVVQKDNPRVVALTEQAGADIIEHDLAGNITLRLLCEDCLKAIYLEEEIEIDFIGNSKLH